MEAKGYVARLPAFMPLDVGDPSSPRRTSSNARCIDVWSQIAAPMSPQWRRRFARDIQEMNESFLWELSNAASDVVPDPSSTSRCAG